MWDTHSPKILVAIGLRASDSLLRTAAEQAHQRRCGLHLLHVVVPDHLSFPDVEAHVAHEAYRHRQGEGVLISAARRLAAIVDDGTPVSTELGVGSIAGALESASEQAVLVMVGNARDRTHLGPSATNAVAARSRCPVIAVPDDTVPGPHRDVPVVTAGIHDAGASLVVLRAACDLADLADARLRIVHVVSGPDELDTGRATIAEVAAAVLASHPAIPVDIDVIVGASADVLVTASADTDLLVVGRHVPRHAVESHLGSVVRAVLMHSRVPVAVIDPSPTPVSVPELRYDVVTIP